MSTLYEQAVQTKKDPLLHLGNEVVEHLLEVTEVLEQRDQTSARRLMKAGANVNERHIMTEKDNEIEAPPA